MTFSRFFKTSSYCLIGSGFVAIAATGSMGGIPIALFTAAFVGSWFLDTDRIRRYSHVAVELHRHRLPDFLRG